MKSDNRICESGKERHLCSFPAEPENCAALGHRTLDLKLRETRVECNSVPLLTSVPQYLSQKGSLCSSGYQISGSSRIQYLSPLRKPTPLIYPGPQDLWVPQEI